MESVSKKICEVNEMKKLMYLFLAVLMVLPLMASCGTTLEGTPVEFANVTVVSYQLAYSEPETGETEVVDPEMAVQLDAQIVVVYVPEEEPDKAITVKDVVDAYARDFDGSQVYDEELNRYTKLKDLGVTDEFFWNYYVNGVPASLSTQVKNTDKIEIRYEK